MDSKQNRGNEKHNYYWTSTARTSTSSVVAVGGSTPIPITDTTTDSETTPKGHPKITISKDIINQRPFRYTNPVNVTGPNAAEKKEKVCSEVTNHSVLYKRRVNFHTTYNAQQDNQYRSKVTDNYIKNPVTAAQSRATEKDKPDGSEFTALAGNSGTLQDIGPIVEPLIHRRRTYPYTVTKKTSKNSPNSAEFLNHTYLPSCSYAYQSNLRKQSSPRFSYPSYKTSKQQCLWMPYYKNHQLLGDSQMLRFSEKLLNFKNFVSYTGGYLKLRRLGYCVKGQKIWDLQNRLRNNEHKLLKKVVLLIGGNDIKQGTSMRHIQESYKSLLSTLKPKTNRIVLLTVPPMPKFVSESSINYNILLFNEFIKKCADGDKVFVVDLAKQYIDSEYTISLQNFEKTYNGNEARVDLVHLNLEGFKLLKALLDNHLVEDDP